MGPLNPGAEVLESMAGRVPGSGVIVYALLRDIKRGRLEDRRRDRTGALVGVAPEAADGVGARRATVSTSVVRAGYTQI